MAKDLSCDFYWLTLYRVASDLAKRYDQCQRASGISKKYEIPLTLILNIYIFNVWGIKFMDPFASSFGNTCNWIVADCVSKWVEDVALPNNELGVWCLFNKNIFTRFRTSREIISDGGSQFFQQVL